MGMTANNEQYGKLVSEKILNEFGHSSTGSWDQCEFMNTTYVDCPVAQKVNETSYTMNVAVHNPSSLDLESAKVPVPPESNYNVMVFNKESQTFEHAYSEKSCFEDHLDDKDLSSVVNCYVDVKVNTPAQAVSLIQMEAAPEPVKANKPEKMTQGNTISGNGLKVVFKGAKPEESTLMFDVYDELAGSKPEEFEFSMKYYQSYAFMIDTAMMNSGAYAFHPMEGQLHPYPYGDVQEVNITQGNYTQEMIITFAKQLYDEKEYSMKSKVHISIDKELPLLKIDVDLEGLPMQEVNNGYEVVPNFHVANFDNNQTFYTDSNGLEMQKRILNYRPTWKMDPNAQPVSQNYYPINSAISMKDITSKRQFTVMNDRSQGGTSMLPGTIELMQNREAPSDDNKGVGEPLREFDEFGIRGMRVKAAYYVQICDGVNRLPLQRVAQQKVHDPANYFYNFNLTRSLDTPVVKDIISEGFKKAGIVDTVKIVHVPKGKNHIHVRLQNLADLYDSNSKTYKVSVATIADTLWKYANSLSPVDYTMDIKEMSLTGNMELKEMWDRKIQWKYADKPNSSNTEEFP